MFELAPLVNYVNLFLLRINTTFRSYLVTHSPTNASSNMFIYSKPLGVSPYSSKIFSLNHYDPHIIYIFQSIKVQNNDLCTNLQHYKLSNDFYSSNIIET